MKDTDTIVVCANCLTAACWNGTDMCLHAYDSGTIDKTVVELRELDLELPIVWQRILES